MKCLKTKSYVFQSASPYQGFDDRQFQAKNEEYKKTADIYLKEFSENSKIMTNSLKKIEDLVVEVLNDQVTFQINLSYSIFQWCDFDLESAKIER